MGLEVDDTAAAPVRVAAGFVIGAQVAGRYRIVRALGTGGMGEVFEVEDLVVGTRVALKALRADRTAPAMIERLRRELALARKVTHRNVCRIHDLGDHDGRVFLTMELLGGETLGERLGRGRLDPAAALAIAEQLTTGLAAAHAAGIVHRDFKSSNVMLVGDRAVVTDFGLARSEIAGEHIDLTGDAAMLGTAAYMAPEQVEGKPVTTAADVYALGVVLFEMITGELPFRGDTPLATAALRLSSDPPSARSRRTDVPLAWDVAIARCLARRPEDRFARVDEVTRSLRGATPRPMRRWWIAGALGAGLVGAVVIGFLLGASRSPTSTPASPQPSLQEPLAAKRPMFQQVSFRRGTVENARFAPDQKSVVYSADFGGRYATYLATLGHPDARTLQAEGSVICAVGGANEMLFREHSGYWWSGSTLFRASLAGGTPRPVLDHVIEAAFGPGRDELTVIRKVGTRKVLEFPVGNMVYDAEDRIDWLRVSPDKSKVAFLRAHGTRWSLLVIDRQGKQVVVLADWLGFNGLAWSADGRELWVTGRRPDLGRATRALYAVDLEGHIRTILEEPGALLTLHDMAADGRVLLSREFETHHMYGRRAKDTADRELSWFDQSYSEDLSASGDVLFNEAGATAGEKDGIAYLRNLDGSPAVRLIDDYGEALSPDGKQMLAFIGRTGKPEELWVVPTGAGTERRLLPRGPIETYSGGAFFPDGKRVVLLGMPAGARREPRVYIQDIAGGEPRPITPPDTSFPGMSNPVSMDGAWIFAAEGKTATVHLYPVAGGERRALPALQNRDAILRWAADGRLFVLRYTGMQASIVAIDPKSGAAERIVELEPPESVGVASIETASISPDGKSYVYSYGQRLSRLYVVDGLR